MEQELIVNLNKSNVSDRFVDVNKMISRKSTWQLFLLKVPALRRLKTIW